MKKKKKQYSISEQKQNDKKTNRIIAIMAIISILTYLISMALYTGVGYDRWIGKPFWWK